MIMTLFLQYVLFSHTWGCWVTFFILFLVGHALLCLSVPDGFVTFGVNYVMHVAVEDAFEYLVLLFFPDR